MSFASPIGQPSQPSSTPLPSPSLVSIVLPTYNGDRYLREAIDGCLQQTHANLELIVVVDASTDRTGGILNAIADPRLHIVRHENNRGLSASLNSGFAQAQGEYLTWTSDDNFYEPEAIERMLSYLRQVRADFVYADFHRIDDSGQTLEVVQLGSPEELLEKNCVGACFLYRREVYTCLGDYNLEARLAEDLEYWLRVYRSFKLAHQPEDLYAYRVHPNSLTGASYNRYEALRVAARARFRILRLGWRRFAQQMAAVDIEEGFARYARGDLSGAQSVFWRALRRNPTWLTNRGVRSVLARSLMQPIQRAGKNQGPPRP